MIKLVEIREKLNLTQEELAEKSGISVRTIQRIESGTPPKGYTLKTLAKALNVNEQELLQKNDVPEDIDATWLKLINLSSLPFALLPPLNVILPLLLMLAKKQFNALTKQIVTIQILWTLLAIVIYMLSAFMKIWFSLGSKFMVCVIILLVLTNVFIILQNAVRLDKNKSLYIGPGFSLI